MKQFLIIYSFFLSVILCGCEKEIIYDRGNLPKEVMIIDSYPAGFTKMESRASKTPFEYEMSCKCMLIFDADNKLVKKEYRQGGDVSFLVDRRLPPFKDYDQTKLDTCKIYIIANLAEKKFENIQSLDDLLNLKIEANKNTIHLDKLSNFIGLPMLGGVDNVDLSQDAQHLDPIAPIVLNTIYAKIVVDIQLKVDQNIPGNIPLFELKKWTVKNIPGYTTLGANSLTAETKFVTDGSTDFVTHAGENKISQGTNPITNGAKHIVLDFYVLEHKVNVDYNSIDTTTIYPSGIKENEKQRFKPNLVKDGQIPMYIEIEGIYTNHQGHNKDVKYLLFLGENNKNNFHIKRNCQIKNNVVIRGITNSKGDGQDISVDNRVIINDSIEDFIVRVERETMLDSHIEIRPMDIQLKEGGAGKVVVEVINPIDSTLITNKQYPWIRFEKRNANPTNDAKYCSNGKRKYFTTTLLNELKDSISTTITDNSDNRIWVYFDENPNASVNGMREAWIRFSYYKDEKVTKEEYYKFRQHDLYPIKITRKSEYTNSDTTTIYYIEYYEEYLYNFDPKDHYGNTTDGMAWGSTGVIYSNSIPAITTVGNLLDWDLLKRIKDRIVEKAGKYDYEKLYEGKRYTQKLIEQGNKKQEADGTTSGNNYFTLPLDKSPRSAAEYCYNKNKRDSNGKVVSMDWYLPAIGETQQITTAAYSKFKVFQEQYYWSSQTSYLPGSWNYTSKYGLTSSHGYFKYEDTKYARATKTKMINGKAEYELSEVNNNLKHLEAKWVGGPLSGHVESEMKDIPGTIPNRDPGNHHRSDILRVRAVRTSLPK